MTIPRATAERIYDEVLVPICGADPRWRNDFCELATLPDADSLNILDPLGGIVVTFYCDSWTVTRWMGHLSPAKVEAANAALSRIRSESAAPTTSPVPAAPAFSEAEVALVEQMLQFLSEWSLAERVPSLMRTPSPAVQATWLEGLPTEPGWYVIENIIGKTHERVQVWQGHGGILLAEMSSGESVPLAALEAHRFAGPLPAPIEPTSAVSGADAELADELLRFLDNLRNGETLFRNPLNKWTRTYISQTVESLAAIIARHLSPEREATGKLRERVAELEAENAGLKAFETDIHAMLDDMGVPFFESAAVHCRAKKRLLWLEQEWKSQRDRAERWKKRSARTTEEAAGLSADLRQMELRAKDATNRATELAAELERLKTKQPRPMNPNIQQHPVGEQCGDHQ